MFWTRLQERFYQVETRGNRPHTKLESAPAPTSGPERGPGFGLALFALLALAAPLAFGAVDRIIQIPLAALLGIALLVTRPTLPRLSPRILVAAVVLAVVLVAKEFLPAAVIGIPGWRHTLSNDYGLALPWTFNVSPATALDAILVVVLAGGWFLLVREISSTARSSVVVIRILVGSALLVAVVSFVMRYYDPSAIYGLRNTPGWQRFGPFPNRNHTADLLAMGAVLSTAFIWRGTLRRHWFRVLLSALTTVVLVGAILASKSRGGLVALCAGLAVLGLLAFLRSRRKSLLVVVASMSLLVGAFVLAFGSSVLERFSDPDEGGISAGNTRLLIWRDTLDLWKEAPILGNGVGTFQGAFPFYSNADLGNVIVLHPESSWLQWLAELGFGPLLAAMALGGIFLWKVVRCLRSPHARDYSITAGALGALAVILVHSVFDVPGHRWGTAGFAIALIGFLARRKNDVRAKSEAPLPDVVWPRFVYIAPILIAVLWSMPLVFRGIEWTPLAIDKILYQVRRDADVSPAAADRELKFFPLDYRLQELAGMLKVRDRWYRDQAWKHFRLLNRLVPTSWSYPAQQAILTAFYDVDMSLYLWGEALRRADTRSNEVLRMALRYTPNTPDAVAFWQSHAMANPHLLLPLAEVLQEPERTNAFQAWVAGRGKQATHYAYEREAFYRLVVSLGAKNEFVTWVGEHADHAEKDAREWAKALVALNEPAAAWQIASSQVPLPLAANSSTIMTQELDRRWHVAPQDWVNAQIYVQRLADEQRANERNSVLAAIAATDGVPAWFLIHHAYALAETGDFGAATKALLKVPRF